MVRWFRHYPGLARDERLQGAALKARQPVERVVWLWCAILEDASTRDADGAFEIDADEAAWFLRIEPADVARILVALEAGGRIREGRVVAWTRRQFASDRSAPRTREWRERHKANGAKPNGKASPKRHGDAPETEAETETETEERDLLGEIPAQKRARLLPQHVVKHWNNLAPRIGKPTVRDLTPERRERLRLRIGQYSVDDFVDVLAKVEASSFLRGDTGWHGCTFDWVTKKANFQKVLEGNYDA